MTDRPDFEPMLERRLQAYAAGAVRTVQPFDIARSTIQAAATTRVARVSILAGPRRPMLLLGLAAVLLTAVVGAAFIAGRTPAIQGAFVDGPSLDGGLIVHALALPDGRVLVGVRPEEGTLPGTTTLRCSVPCQPHLEFLDLRTGAFSDTAATPAGLTIGSLALLHDGRVLIISESSDSSTRQPATIYDPVADRFEETGAPVEPRTWPLLVTLADGRVLVAGDNVGNAALATAELFDPVTGTFSMTGSMTRPRGIGASAVLLRDGRVLVVGGGAEVGDSAELFDPDTGTFTPTGSMTQARGGFLSATLLDDGRVLVAGGLILHPTEPTTIAPEPAATAEIYDPATGRFTAVGSMAAPRYMHSASILTDGTVLVAGGSHERPPEGGVPPTTDAEIFDPSTGTFHPTGSLRLGRLMPATVAVDDRVLVLGSFDPAGQYPVTGASTEWFE